MRQPAHRDERSSESTLGPARPPGQQLPSPGRGRASQPLLCSDKGGPFEFPGPDGSAAGSLPARAHPGPGPSQQHEPDSDGTVTAHARSLSRRPSLGPL